MVFPGAPVESPDPRDVHDFLVALASALCRLSGKPEQKEDVVPRGHPPDLRSRIAAAAAAGKTDVGVVRSSG